MLGSFEIADKISALSLIDKSESLLSGSHDLTIRKWNLSTLQCEKVIEAHRGSISFISSLNNSANFISGGTDRKVFIYNNSGEIIKKLSYQTGIIKYSVQIQNFNLAFGDSNGNIFIEALNV